MTFPLRFSVIRVLVKCNPDLTRFGECCGGEDMSKCGLCVSWYSWICDVLFCCSYVIQQSVNINIGPLWWDAAGADGSLRASLLGHLRPPQVVLHTDKLWDLLLVLPLPNLLLLVLEETKDKSIINYNIVLHWCMQLVLAIFIIQLVVAVMPLKGKLEGSWVCKVFFAKCWVI